jgi:hypothetical protein
MVVTANVTSIATTEEHQALKSVPPLVVAIPVTSTSRQWVVSMDWGLGRGTSVGFSTTP